MAEEITKKKYITDNVVKMQWEASKALYLNGGRKGKTFIYASKDYETSVGTITVFFNCYTAFIWADEAGTEDEDRYNAREMKTWLKDNLDDAFPLNYSNYIPVIDYGADEVNQEIIDKYDLGEYVSDILDRLEDVRPYSEETIATL